MYNGEECKCNEILVIQRFIKKCNNVYKNLETINYNKQSICYKDIYVFDMSNRNTNDLFDFNSTKKHIKNVNPDCIVNAAAKVGGININNEKRFEFITENLKINMNILESCLENKPIRIIT